MEFENRHQAEFFLAMEALGREVKLIGDYSQPAMLGRYETE